jgi:hypothetical protein
VNKRIQTSFLALVIALMACAQGTLAQRRRAAAPVTPVNVAPLNLLPPSDLVALVDLKRLINEALPKVLANDPAKLAEVNAQIDKLKAQTGIDARSFERIAVGLRYVKPSPNVTTADTVVILRGTFNSGALLAAARLAAKGKSQEEKYKGTTIYTFNVNDQLGIPGLASLKVRDLSALALDANTLVVGEPAVVRATLDASAARTSANANLIQLAARNPRALISFSANVPASLLQGLDLGNDELGKVVGSIRQAAGALGTTEKGFELLAMARTERPEQAQTLTDTLSSLKQFGGMLIPQLPPDLGKLAQNALDSLKITAQGNDSQLSLELAQADISTLLRVMQPKKPETR